MTDIVERLQFELKAAKAEIEIADGEIERLTKERDFARDAVVQKCRQYDADMEIMRLSLNREIAETKSLREQLVTVREIREYDRAEIKRLRKLT